MKCEHTQGDWKVVTGQVVTEDGRPLANMVRNYAETGVSPVESDCNAYVMAAASEMLSILEEIHASDATGNFHWFKVYDVIAKATTNHEDL